jgi:cobalt-zinc-cadmium efflux system protein
MGLHHHHHTHAQGTEPEESSDTRSIGQALLLNLSFTLLELVGGVLTNSLAVISDAVHDLGDSLALGMGYLAERKARHKATDENYTYGFRRLPLLSAALNALILLGGSAWVISQAIGRLQAPERVDTQWMLPLAALGVLVNGWAVFRLSKGKGINSRMLRLHLLEDALGWIAVLLGAIVMHFTGFYLIDPLLSLLIAAYIIYHAAGNLRQVYRLLAQRSPAEIAVADIRQQIESLPQVEQVLDLHIWSLEGTRHILSCHLAVAIDIPLSEQQKLKTSIRRMLSQYGQFHSTIELDFGAGQCADHCQ